ncbi:nucleotidyltransferase substrate binding protein [Methylocucumis oryzae]|uniref:Nucleotidyltransferase n=1 Tax=Methylocucumis oryzae TaxID=1632867 RepID=A0A0F3IKC7_9GAMM|nr:nucleotidyltransferase substrate binding protein [Methylocucumis oryzae]KJV07180.1 nucleotidyltransferase [Methylocucumis oryzae]
MQTSIDYSKFKKSLRQLELQFANYQNSAHRKDLSELDKEAIAESVIQRFETCYDCVWKHLKRYLIEILGLPEVPNSPKPIFRIAAENLLLQVATEQWLSYADARIQTAHDYDGEKAKIALALMTDFIADATQLYQTLTGESWS